MDEINDTATETPEAAEEGSSEETPVIEEGTTEEENPEVGGGAGGGGSYEPEEEAEETDWYHVAELIANANERKQPQTEIIETDYGELRIVHSVTTGDLLVSFLLLATISIFLIRWVFKAVWGR